MNYKKLKRISQKYNVNNKTEDKFIRDCLKISYWVYEITVAPSGTYMEWVNLYVRFLMCS